MKGLSELTVSSFATDYFGAKFEVKPCSGFVLVVYGGFRSAPVSRETFSFILEEYSDQPYRKLVCDMRRAGYPDDDNQMRARFAEQAAALPTSTIVGLSTDPSSPTMVAAVEEFRKAGHECFITDDETEALRLITSAARPKAMV